MAGVGRRTLYRKSVTDDYLNSTPEPGDNEEIVLVRAPRGSNIIEIVLLSGEQALAILPTRFRKLIWVKRGDYLIASTSVGDFETSAGEAGKVRYRVEHILNKEQIKHLKKRGLWPEPDAFGGALPLAGPGSGNPREGWGDAIAGGNPDDETKGVAPSTVVADEGNGVSVAAVAAGVSACCIGVDKGAVGDGGGIEGGGGEEEEEEEEDDMSDLFVNNNRAAMMQLRTDHEDEEESNSEDEDEDSDEESSR